VNRYFGKKLYSVLDVRHTKARADKLAKEWREEGFSVRVTRCPNGKWGSASPRYLVWKSIERSARALALRRKSYRPTKKG